MVKRAIVALEQSKTESSVRWHARANREPVGAIAIKHALHSLASVADCTIGAVSPLVQRNKKRSSGEAVFAVNS